jgi:hypothetical protein
LTQESHFSSLPVGTRGGAAVHHTFPLDAEYEIQVRLARNRNEQVEGFSEPHDLEITLDGARVRLFTVTPVPHKEGVALVYHNERDVDVGLNVRLAVKAGPHTLTTTFLEKSAALIETERQPYQAHFNMDRHPRNQPAIYSISIVGPFDPDGAGDTPSRRRIFVCRPSRPAAEPACARTILSALAQRAYRRPVADADIRPLLAFYERARTARGFEGGIEAALRSLLVSPNFLFRIEREPPNIAGHTAYRVSELDLASRLSFFLWSSIPDDELLRLAIDKTLSQPSVLRRQVSRMLADPRSQALVQSFAAQWLYLRNLDAVSPDPRSFPDFDDNLRQAFRSETELFVESIIREDRNVLDFLRADYTFLNERLARHYGIPGVYTSEFKRVTLDADSVRGGLLGQGSILTVSSYANRTSPVLRGKWILDNILGMPPPPPPPNVPPLADNNRGGRTLSMRERMAQHSTNPACSGCHRLMDPVGFSMENFDSVGKWRTRSESGSAIDSSGGLPDGSTFEGVSGLRQALLRRPELFVNTMTEKLLTYALGRGLEYYDAVAVRNIVRNARAHDFRFSSLITGIVSSVPFQMRRSR